MIEPINLSKEENRNLKMKTNSFEQYVNKLELKKGYPVYLKIYHLSIINMFLQIFGLGIFHTTIEINQYEYSFGATQSAIPGLFFSKVDSLNSLKLKERIYLGNTLYTTRTINKLLSLNKSYWLGNTYDPFVKNCNHFTKFLARLLLKNVIDYPTYINRICKYGMLFTSFYPPIKRVYGIIIYKLNHQYNNVINRSSSKNIQSKTDLPDINLNTKSNVEEVLSRNTSTIFEEIMGMNPYLKGGDFHFPLLTSRETEVIRSHISDISRAASNRKEDLLLKYINRSKSQKNFEESFSNINNSSKIVISPKQVMYHLLFELYFKEGDIQNMEKTANKLLSLDTNDKYATFNLAYVRYLQFRFPECEELLNSAIAAFEKNHDVLYVKKLQEFKEMLNECS